jgi:ribosomal protein L37E
MAHPGIHGDPNIGVTTVEVGERRHLVQPYAERPVLQRARGVVACAFCGNPQFRRSRLRASDIPELLMLRYPLRCTRCGQRQYNNLYVALLAYGPRKVSSVR